MNDDFATDCLLDVGLCIDGLLWALRFGNKISVQHLGEVFIEAGGDQTLLWKGITATAVGLKNKEQQRFVQAVNLLSKLSGIDRRSKEVIQ